MPFDLPRRDPERSANTPRTTPFDRLGGRAIVRRLIEAFYRRVAADELLRPLFPEDLAPGIEKQVLFMEQWLGGAPRYSLEHGQPMLRRRHFPFVIGREAADRWLTHMRAALEEVQATPALIDEVMQRLEPLAHHMVNADEDVPRGPLPRS
ncbi:MAG: globin [Dehalococcoidia bacterium]|nr:globin [Dehalococcoidia bacterium]